MNKAIYTTRQVPIALDEEHSQRKELLASIDSVKGIRAITYNEAKHMLAVEYDLMVMSFGTLLSMIEEKGVKIQGSIMFSLLSSWLNYIDRTAKSNALAPPPSCCNKPPSRGRR